MQISDITGVILAGGYSSRMKANKAFVKVGGIAIIDRIIPEFARAFQETMIICNEPELYQAYGVPVFADIYPRQGPVSGIHAGLFYASKNWIYVQSCDLPFMNPDLAKMLGQKAASGDYDCVVPEIDGHLQPLSALYRKTAMPIMEDCLSHDRLKLTRVIAEELVMCRVPESQLESLGDLSLMFLNVNDEDTLYIAEQRARGL